MNTRLLTISLVFLVSGPVTTAMADNWAVPKTLSVESSSKALRLTVLPPELTNVMALSSLYLEDYLLIERLEGNTAGKRLHCEGVLERVSRDGKAEFLWRRPLVNRVAPLGSYGSDNVNGGFIITLDDWHAVGTGSHTVVIYNLAGKQICAKTLDDLIGKKEKQRLKRTASSIIWAGKHRFDEAGKHLVLQIGAPPQFKEVRIELASGNVVRD